MDIGIYTINIYINRIYSSKLKVYFFLHKQTLLDELLLFVVFKVCIWAVKHDRTFELELFCAVNVLQFIFLALKLDGLITWSWEVVFVPFWALLCLSLIAVLYTIIIAAALLRAPQVNARVRANSVNSALAYTFLVVPMIVFQVNITLFINL